LVIELQDGAVQCAADTWVQVTEHAAADAADSSTSSSSQPGAEQQQAVVADHSNCSSSIAGQELLVAAQQASSSDLQLMLDWQARTVQGFTVQVAEAKEVFRTLEEQSSSSSSKRIQYWDAFSGAWQEVHVPSRVVAGEAVAVTAS
jgi:hypothetical protein